MSEERAAVLSRLDKLQPSSKRAGRVHDYVETAHDAHVTVTDFLHVIRSDSGLALELRSNTGRTVICAVETDDGTVGYPIWHHSAVAAKAGYGDVQVRSIDRRHEVEDAIEDRYPIIRLRSETPLADLSGYGLEDRRVLADGGVEQSAGGIERFLSCPECDSEDISYRVNNGRLVLTCEDCLETTSKLVGRATFR